MIDDYERFSKAILEGNVDLVKSLAANGLDLNVPCNDGAPPLFRAVLCGNLAIIRFMLEAGADPNFIASEPAFSDYAEKPLGLALQARFCMDWEKYDPIVKLLEEFGATDYDYGVSQK